MYIWNKSREGGKKVQEMKKMRRFFFRANNWISSKSWQFGLGRENQTLTLTYTKRQWRFPSFQLWSTSHCRQTKKLHGKPQKKRPIQLPVALSILFFVLSIGRRIRTVTVRILTVLTIVFFCPRRSRAASEILSGWTGQNPRNQQAKNGARLCVKKESESLSLSLYVRDDSVAVLWIYGQAFFSTAWRSPVLEETTADEGNAFSWLITRTVDVWGQ